MRGSSDGRAAYIDFVRQWTAYEMRISDWSSEVCSSDLNASAQRPELVQMLDVAFWRRICCSRVESVSTKPRLPAASTVSPQRRPGIWRTYFCLHANRPR